MWLCYLCGYTSSYNQKTPQLLVLSTCSNFSVILAILFGKLAKTPVIAEATLTMDGQVQNKTK